MNILEIEADLNTDQFGDIQFHNGDISVTKNKNKIAKLNAIHRILSSHGDLYMHRLYGANISKHIGQRLDLATETLVTSSIYHCLIEDKFLTRDMVEVIPIQDSDKLFYKIATGVTEGFMSDKKNEINVSISPSGGVAYV